MARVFSWKVAPNKYSYLIKENGTYIRSRIIDPDTLHHIADTVDAWSETKYRDEFNAMRAEVNNVYNNFHDSDYTKYFNASPVQGMDIVLLSGKDFYGSGTDGDGGLKDILSEDDYEALREAIEETFRQYRDEIESNAQNIRAAIEAQVSTTLMEALNRIAETKNELDGIRNELTETARNLQDALDAARNAEQGGVTQEELDNITRSISQFKNWLLDYSGSVVTMKNDYDQARRYMGSISSQEDVARGLFSLLCTNINTLSGTVGTVARTMDASSGGISDNATWYNELNSQITDLTRRMNAKEGIIEDLANFVDGNNTNSVYSRISAVASSIVNGASHHGTDESGNTVDLTDVYQLISALSGRVRTEINRLDNASGRITSIITDLDSLDGRITTSLTRANSAMTAAIDMRETWDSEVGILRTVSDMVIKKDANGDPIYWYINPNLEDPSDKTQWVRVYYQGEGNDGLPYYTTQRSGSGTRYTSNVLPDYMSTMLSYIQQQSDSIEFAVTSGDVITALKLTVTPNGDRIIYGLADKVLLDSDVITKAISANTANIGGVYIGAGMISAKTGSNKWSLSKTGVLEATGAKISGAITATSLYLGTTAQNQLNGVIDSRISNFNVNGEGLSEEDVNQMLAAAAATSGWGAVNMGQYYKVGTPVVSGTSSFTVSTNGLLVANNAVISGTVCATNGIFNGTIYARDGEFNGTVKAADIFLDGKSLKLSSGGYNGLEISNSAITIDYIPLTVTFNKVTHIFQSQNRDPYFSDTFRQITATGSTQITLPSVYAYFNAEDYNGGVHQLVCSGASFVMSGASDPTKLLVSGITTNCIAINRTYYSSSGNAE